jgi:AraC-like DNA-binding protein
MLGNGTVAFSDPDDFQADLRKWGLEIVLTVGGDFKARLTRVKLRQLRLLLGREEQPRIAYVSLAPERAFVTFSVQSDRPLIWGGVELQPGDVVFHGQGEQLHQRTCGACHWASISLTPEHLAAYGKALTGKDLAPPLAGQVLRHSGAALTRLRQLHAAACHLVEKKPQLITHPEVARALEHDLTYALVTCLIAGFHHRNMAPSRRRADIMRQFELALEAHPDRLPHLPELRRAVGVPERTLRICCAEFLGIGPTRYLRLRRLGMVRAALRHANPATTSVSEIAIRHGFLQLGRFTAAYRTEFREAPSTTLGQTPKDACDVERAASP